jgi:hypothetical protein
LPKRKTLIILVLTLLVMFVLLVLIEYQRLHNRFDPVLWRRDISSRYGMSDRAERGMTEKQVRALYGPPELESSHSREKVFMYRILFGTDKAVLYIYIQDDKVVETHLDESGGAEYEEIETHLSEPSSKAAK